MVFIYMISASLKIKSLMSKTKTEKYLISRARLLIKEEM